MHVSVFIVALALLVSALILMESRTALAAEEEHATGEEVVLEQDQEQDQPHAQNPVDGDAAPPQVDAQSSNRSAGVASDVPPTPMAIPPTPTPISGGPTDISPNNSDSAYPGTVVTYRHIVTHQGGAAVDVKNIVPTSSQGWRVELFHADGERRLRDTNQDGLLDTGSVARGEWIEIVVRITVPEELPEGVRDVTTVKAISAGNPSPANEDTATNITTVVHPPPTATPEPTPTASGSEPLEEAAKEEDEPAEPAATPTEAAPDESVPEDSDAGDTAATTVEDTPDPTATPAEETSDVERTSESEAVSATSDDADEPAWVANASEGPTMAISAGSEQDAEPGTLVDYEHTVTNLGKAAHLNVAATSSEGWPVTILAVHPVTKDVAPMADNNGDGLPDVGELLRGETRSFLVQVAVPEDAAIDTRDITTVTVTSARDLEPDNVATATNTATVIAAPANLTAISPTDAAETADPGTVVAYSFTVTHLGDPSSDTKNITAASSQGWEVTLFEEDGITPLADTNGDGIPDTGELDLSATPSQTIVVALAVPADAPAATGDVLSVTASPSGPGDPVSAVAITTVNESLTVSVSSDTDLISFGPVSPTGEGGGIPDDLGAYYIYDQPVQVTVASNGHASAAICRVDDREGSTVADGRLEWSRDGGATWTAFTPGDNACLPTQSAGTHTYTLDYRLRVNWSDPPGAFGVTIAYEPPTQAPAPIQAGDAHDG